MPRAESYIGSPEYDADAGSWGIELDTELRTNFVGICELVTSIFDAQSCGLYANFSQHTLLVTTIGASLDLTDADIAELRSATELSEQCVGGPSGTSGQDAQSESTLQRYRVVNPIVMPSGLAIGSLVFFRPATQVLSAKERSILRVINRDIVSHLLHSKEVFESAKLRSLESLISDNNDDWIFVKDEQFRIVYANDAFLSVYPEDMRDRVIGYTTVEEYDEAEAELFLAQDKVAFAQGQSKVIEDLHMPDGRHIIVETVKRRFEDDKGRRYILGVCRDITAREDLIRELKKANDDLGHFTSIASHDLKSPLNAIRRLLQWIEEDCAPLLPEEHLENMHLVVSRADRMEALLDDLLTYARIGKEDVTSTDVNLLELYADIAQLLDVPDSVTVTVADATLSVPAVPFKTTLLNLIGNAIKHNDKEHGRVDVTVEESRHFYLIEVKDNGPGIDSRYFEQIFQLFQTLRPRDEVEGSGIGLSVVMKYVSNFGGSINVDSDGKTGSNFKLHWPKRIQKNGA